MVCDYLGAGNAYSKENFSLQGELEWWENKKKNHIAMSKPIFHFVDIMMKTMAKENEVKVIMTKHVLIKYIECVLKNIHKNYFLNKLKPLFLQGF